MSERPKIDDEHPDHTRDDWRNEVVHETTCLGYWEWVWHHLESDDVKNPLRQLPAEVAITIDPFDIWWIPETLLYQSDAVQFARLLHSIISLSKFNEDQTDLIAEHMCVSDKTVENIMDRVEVSYGRIVQSCQDQYPNEQDEATGG